MSTLARMKKSTMTKSQRHEAIRERAAEAIQNLYHNATPSYPGLDTREECDHFDSWFQDTAMFEIDYLGSGGAYGTNYAKTLRASCNAGKFQTKRAQDYYVRRNLRSMAEDRSHNMWEYITETYGKLYQYGRGGRTLAPESLVRTRGGSSFSVDESYFEDRSIASVVEGIQILESFNDYVEKWCKGVPEMWKDYVRENTLEGLEENVVLSNN